LGKCVRKKPNRKKREFEYKDKTILFFKKDLTDRFHKGILPLVFMFFPLFFFLNVCLCSFIPKIPLHTIKGSRLVSQQYPELRTILLIILNNEALLKSFYSVIPPSIKDDPKVGFWYDVLKLAIWKSLSSDALLDLDRLIEDGKAEFTKRETTEPSKPGDVKRVIDYKPYPPFFKELLDSQDISVSIFDETGKKVPNEVPIVFTCMDVNKELLKYPLIESSTKNGKTFSYTKKLEHSGSLLKINIGPSTFRLDLNVPQILVFNSKRYVLSMINDNIVRSSKDGAFYKLSDHPSFVHFETAIYHNTLKSLMYIEDQKSGIKIYDPFVLNFMADPEITFRKALFFALASLFGCLAVSSFVINAFSLKR
jgi:hypothetical protein